MKPRHRDAQRGINWKSATAGIARRRATLIPWFPLAVGKLAGPGSPLFEAAEHLRASPGQIAVAWLLKKSPVMLSIPGASQASRLESNTAAANVEINDDLAARLDHIAG